MIIFKGRLLSFISFFLFQFLVDPWVEFAERQLFLFLTLPDVSSRSVFVVDEMVHFVTTAGRYFDTHNVLTQSFASGTEKSLWVIDWYEIYWDEFINSVFLIGLFDGFRELFSLFLEHSLFLLIKVVSLLDLRILLFLQLIRDGKDFVENFWGEEEQ